jgi:hypothetical protein
MFKKYQTQIAVTLFAIAWIFGIFFLITSQPKHGVQVINCSIAEISPDFTTEMREACRKARSGRI